MAEIPAGTWVEIHSVVLTPDERAPHLPADTREVPLEMRVKGFLVGTAELGQEVQIVTPAGRNVRGTLSEVNPAYTHSFGSSIPELLSISADVRARLRREGISA